MVVCKFLGPFSTTEIRTLPAAPAAGDVVHLNGKPYTVVRRVFRDPWTVLEVIVQDAI